MAAILIIFPVSQALAQPSPEPAGQPTPEQAKQFVETMTAQYGSTSCNPVKKSGEDTDRYNNSNEFLAKINGGQIIIQQTIRSVEVLDGLSPDSSFLRQTDSAQLSDINFTVEPDTSESDSVICHFPARINMVCKSKGCIKTTSDGVSATQGRSLPANPQINNGETRSVSFAFLNINDTGIASRILRALQFYQTHSSSAAPSPF